MALNGSLDGLAEAGLEVGGFFGGLTDGGMVKFIVTIAVVGAVALLIRNLAKGTGNLVGNTMRG